MRDVATQLPVGAVESTIATQGLPSTVEGGIAFGARFVLDQLGFTPERLAAMGIPKERIDLLMNSPSVLPTSEGITRTVESVTGPLPQPQTTAGEFARTIGQFAPAAVAGRGGLVRRAAQTIIPAVASETAGQATKGTPQEPFARIGGALAGGLAPTLRQLSLRVAAARKAFIPDAPTTEQLQASKTRLFKLAEAEGVQIKSEPLQRFVATLKIKAKADKDLHPSAAALLRRIENDAQRPLTLEEFNTLRQFAGDVAGSAVPGERRIGTIVISALDDFLEALPPRSVISGNPQRAAQILKEARSVNTRFRKSQLIDELFERAENKTGANFTQAGFETALRQEFKSLAQKLAKQPPPADMRGFTAGEKALIRKVARGGPIQNAARLLGKFAPRGVISGAVTGGAFAVSPFVGAPLLGASELARFLSTRATLQNANRARNAIRSGPSPSLASHLLRQ